MITFQDVSRFYGKFKALDKISFAINKGDIVALLGPNGAGKTTTMRILTGFLPPSEGKTSIDGMDIFDEPETVKTMLGYLPENPPLYPELTVLEYLRFVAELRRVPKESIDKNVNRAIDMTDLGDRRNTMIGYLSKGLKQRAGIAQAIVNSPKVLVLDEPTVGLDPVQVIDIRNLIKKLAHEENRTVILSTHILAEAAEICSKAIIINNGKIVGFDSIDNLRDQYAKTMRVSFKIRDLTDSLMEKVRRIPGVLSAETDGEYFTISADTDVREAAAEAIVSSGSGLLEMVRKGGTLEDIFVKLVQ